MHHALVIQELLLGIFGHAYARPRDLASLARTCRAFKEPALDILWEDLTNLSVLVPCPPPEASHRCEGNPECYSFHRLPTSTGWETLRSYTRRIRYIHLRSVTGPDQKSLESLSKPPSGGSLFPNVRHLRLDGHALTEYAFLFFMPFPFLTLLAVEVYEYDPPLLEKSLNSLVKTSPKLEELSIYGCNPDYVDTSGINPRFVCQLQNLKKVSLPEIYLDVTSLVHLTSLPALTFLSVTVCSTLRVEILRHGPLLFPQLVDVELYSDFLETISQLLSRAWLPRTIHLNVFAKHSPSRQNLSSFFSSIKTSGMDRIIELSLEELPPVRHTYVPQSDTHAVYLEDLEPCMAFRNLIRFTFDIKCEVKLTGNDLLVLMSNWSHLRRLCINEQWGWNTRGGVTPDGLRALILENPVLRRLTLAIDTRGYTTIPPFSPEYSIIFRGGIDVVDSFIEAKSVPAIAAFFSGMVAKRSFGSCFSAWNYPQMARNPNRAVCEDLWQEVFEMCQ